MVAKTSAGSAEIAHIMLLEVAVVCITLRLSFWIMLVVLSARLISIVLCLHFLDHSSSRTTLRQPYCWSVSIILFARACSLFIILSCWRVSIELFARACFLSHPNSNMLVSTTQYKLYVTIKTQWPTSRPGPQLNPTSIIAGQLIFYVLVNNLWWWSVFQALSAMSSNKDELVSERMANKSIFFMQFSHLHSHAHRSIGVFPPVDTIKL